MAKSADGDDRVLAAAQHIMKSIGTSKNMKEDMMFILSNLGSRFADIGEVLSSGDDDGMGELRHQLEAAEEVILAWDADSGPRGQCFLFSEGFMDEATAYLSTVDDVIGIVRELESLDDGGELLKRAESVLQMAMAKLEDEFRYVLVSNTGVLDVDELYESMHRFSNAVEMDSPHSVEFANVNSDDGEDDRIEVSKSTLVELVNAVGVNDLKDIADRMIRARYDRECSLVYNSIRREAMEEYLALLGVESMGIDELRMIEWSALDEKMKNWSQAVKVVVKVVLPAEKQLCDHVFAESSLIKGNCFGEISKACVTQLIQFADAVSVGQRAPEKLFRILDMYDALSDVLPDLKLVLYDGMGAYMCQEAEVILSRLGEAAKDTFEEFEKAIKGETSRRPTLGGEIHPLTRYVMNYVKLLVDYGDTLNRLFDDISHEQKGPPIAYNDGSDSRIGDGSPLADRLLSILSSLESNLEEKSKLYDDKAMRYVFMMNNIHYIVEKVKGSDLGKLLGDQWVRMHRGKIRQCATCYLRASWSKVLACIKEDGFGSSVGNSSSGFKTSLKEKFKNFNQAFEEIYKIQTTWKVPDPQLKEEMRISISEKVIPAYRSFMGRYRHQVESGRNAGKYVKYTADDLDHYLLDFFEGTPGTMNQLRRRAIG